MRSFQGCPKLSGICTATTSPRAVATPPANTVVSTTTLRPLISFTCPANFQLNQRRWLEKVHVQRPGDESERGQRIHVAIFLPVHGCCSSSSAVTVDQRGNQTAVGETQHRGVKRLRLKPGHGFVALPDRLDLVAVRVVAAAAIAMRHVFRVMVLKSVHGFHFGVESNSGGLHHGVGRMAHAQAGGVLIGISSGKRLRSSAWPNGTGAWRAG